ncbi:hypothetical protein BsWGS_07738 [Bradybaena similaris]
MSFSDKPIRYIGFGAAIGESLSPLMDMDLVRVCYTIGALFILAHVGMDIIDTGDLFKALDTLIFELIASALIPTVAAIHLMRLLFKLLGRLEVDSALLEYIPTAVTLLLIIATSDLRDDLVNKLMDMTIRKLIM